MHSAFAGEVRFVVENNGVERIDTGFNKNMILNQGLHFFGGVAGLDMMSYCVVGSGNSQPTVTQNQLDNCVFGVVGEPYSSSSDYANDGSNTYKCSLTKKYIFTTLAGKNISEVGLASLYSGPSSNYLCTRALIKDINGSPTVLSLIEGDTLTVYYRLWVVHSTLDANQVINISDGFGGSESFNIKKKVLRVGLSKWAELLSKKIDVVASEVFTYTGDLQPIDGGYPSGPLGGATSSALRPYNSDYILIADLQFGTSTANGNLRTVTFQPFNGHCFGYRQIRFGRVSDDAPLSKDNTKELTIPIKFTWGRYEGVL